MDFKKFRTHSSAAKWLGVDSRTVKKYEKIKYSISKECFYPGAKIKTCKLCFNETLSSLCRAGYCKECSAKGAGKIEQGKIISEKYKGSGNPNYIDGKSAIKNQLRGNKDYKQFIKEVLSNINYCEFSGVKENLNVHHIIPIGIYPKYIFCKWNVIVLSNAVHYNLHKNRIDVNMIPSLFNLQSLDEIKTLCLKELNKIDLIEEKIYSHTDYIKIIVKNYKASIEKRFGKIDLVKLENHIDLLNLSINQK